MALAHMIDFDAWDATDTATYLRAKLGKARAWSDFLVDCIRDRTEFCGLTLKPLAYLHNRCGRPVYRIDDVRDFVTRALALMPQPPRDVRLQSIRVRLSADQLCLPVRYRKAQRALICNGSSAP